MNDTTYTSVFKKELQDLVDLKRALGFAYQTEACAFRIPAAARASTTSAIPTA